MKRKKVIRITIIIVILAIIGWVVYANFFKTTKIKTEIETAVITKGTISTMITATGSVEPIAQVEVGTQVSGTIEKIYVDFNDVVKAGQLIAELDKVNLRASLEDAEASYQTALNEQNYLQTVFNRQEALYKNKVISQSDYDEALYKLNNSKGSVVQRLSDLNRAKTNLGYANIYSPVDGVILDRAVDEGQTVAASYSTPTLFTIAQDLSKMQVEANVDEADIGNVKTGQRVSFTVDSYPDEEFSGEVTQVRLNATVTSNVVTYVVVIKADNPELKLMPGMTASINIYTMEMNDVLLLPAKATRFTPEKSQLGKKPKRADQNGEQPDSGQMNKKLVHTVIEEGLSANQKTIWIPTDEGGMRPEIVEVGKTDGVNYQIISGLKEGDKVVLSVKEIIESAEKESTSSPFMPTPPGQNKTK